MRRDQGLARVAVVVGGAAFLVIVAVAVPLVTGAPRPTTADLVVIVGLCAVATRLVAAGRDVTTVAVLLAAAVWTVTGVATSLPGPVGSPVARWVLVPHAVLVVVLAAALAGRRRVAGSVVLAAVAALAAGAGLDVPVLVLLGSALLVAVVLAQPGTPPGVRAATTALAVALVLVDPHVVGDALDPRSLATLVDLLLLGIAATATWCLTSDPTGRLDVASAQRGADEVGAWLARVLRVPRLQVAFPSERGAVDSDGQPATYPRGAASLTGPVGVVAYVSPRVPVDAAVRESLVATLGRLGEIARLRAECRAQAEAVVASRGRLQAAADEESRRLERQLDETLLARLDRMDALLASSSDPLLTERVEDVRRELLRHARGLDPLAGRSLADALAAYRSRGVRVEITELGDVEPSTATTAWYVATEGITNATKHAPGSEVRLEVARDADTLRVVVRDQGRGGADPRGAGLQGLADRVSAAGGDLSVVSGPDGTLVGCVLPAAGLPDAGVREDAPPMLAARAQGHAMSRPFSALVLAVVLASATLTACREPLSRTGETSPPVTLEAAWGQGPTGIGGDVLMSLIDGTHDAAVRISEGTPPRAGDPSEERHGVEAVMAGKADITVVRAGVLQLLGADSLAPLGAPFVVTNNDQAAAIAADPELAQQLMSGLGTLGLVGLGLVPGGLRHPFAFGDKALLRAEDYRDQVINVREDAGVQAMLDQLGALADHSVDSERHREIGKRLRGIEVSMQQVEAVDLPAVQTANVSLYEKFDVAVVRRDTWDGLTTTQRDELLTSFVVAAQDAVGSRMSEEGGQASWCRTPGATTVLATRSQLATLHATLDPITDRLAEDPATGRALDRMRELGVGTVDSTPLACSPVTTEAAADYYVTPEGSQNVLDGLWRLEVDEQDLLDARASPHDAYVNAGVWEFRITDGYADGTQPLGQRCNGQFAFAGAQVSVDFGVHGVEDCGGLMRGTYRINGNRVFFDWQKELEYDLFLDQVMFAPGMVRIE